MKRNSTQENKLSMLLSYTSKDEFLREYRKDEMLKCKKPEELYLHILTELKKAILEGNIDNFEKLCNLIDYISEVEDAVVLRDYYENLSNPIKSTNLVILASKHNKTKILDYLFASSNKILNNLYIDVGQISILPHDEDEEKHNAFYYVIRSGSIDLLDTLINKWPRDYFALHLDELDKILSKTYDELKLKNVPLSDEMEVFVETKLINLRFFPNKSEQIDSLEDRFHNIRERIELVLNSISLLKTDYSRTDEVDEKFLYVAKSIAKNIHILKQQLKSTYDRIPWEETEFLIVIFISSHIKRKQIHLYYDTILNKSKILMYMEYFGKTLEGVNDNLKGVNIGQLACLPELKREEVVEKIISSYPQFEDFYKDYQEIMDLYSLEIISNQINLISSSDPGEIEGRLAITRGLQVIAEYLKSNLECPKLSRNASKLFLLSLQEKSRKIVVDLRDAPSYTDSIWKRIEIEQNAEVDFFMNIQSDTKEVGDVVTHIFYKNKIKIAKVFLNKIVNSENCKEINKIVEDLRIVKFNKMRSGKFENMECQKLIKFFQELGYFRTHYGKRLVVKIETLLENMLNSTVFFTINYATHINVKELESLNNCLEKNQSNDFFITRMKFLANETVQNFDRKINLQNYKEITELLIQLLSNDDEGSILNDKRDEVSRSICKILLFTIFETDDIKCTEKLIEVLNKKVSIISVPTQNKVYEVTEEKYGNQLATKLDAIKRILTNNSLSDQLTTENLISYKNDERVQAVIKILVLDIMSVLDRSKHCLEKDLLVLDMCTPVLTGKFLRNYLAHGNALVDVLSSDPSLAVFLKAKTLTKQHNTEIINKNIRKLLSYDPFELRNKYQHDLATITNQKKMFIALKEGNLESSMDCLKNGTDVNARSINSWNTLHVAAKDSTLEVIKFILDQKVIVNVKDINGQSPLHVAAAKGRKNIVEFFIKEVGLHVDDLNKKDQTALHLAAQNGHIETVEVLLKSKANFSLQDYNGFSALHYAIRCNHIDVAKILIKEDVHDFDINDTISNFTPLHEAAGNGDLELVQFLLQNKANVNTRNDQTWTPSHIAVKHGYVQVVNVLLLHGADVNATILNKIAPLHLAIKFGHEHIANILLKHGADVKASDGKHQKPLHYAAKYGQEGIVRTLLENKTVDHCLYSEHDLSTPLYLAVQGNHVEIVAALLNYGFNVNCKNRSNNDTPLYRAAELGHKNVVELLIKNGAQIQSGYFSIGSTPLHIATLKGYREVVDLLIEHKAKVNAQDQMGCTPLHSAATNGSTDIIDLLIKSKAKINAKNNDGETPLHAAAIEGHTDAVAFLIQKKAKVNARDCYGYTPLHFAVVKGHKNVVNHLIKNNAEVNVSADINPLNSNSRNRIKDIMGEYEYYPVLNCSSTPLVLAIQNCHKDIVETLIANGANVNPSNRGYMVLALSQAVAVGNIDIIKILLKNKANVNQSNNFDFLTPLHLAAQKGNKKVVIALIDNGAVIDCFNRDYETPLHFAAKNDHVDVVKILIENGADINFKKSLNCKFTPLHRAICSGNNKVVKVLVDNKVNINYYDKENNLLSILKTALFQCDLQVLKMLLQYKKVDIVNVRYPDDMTLLHIASQGRNLEIVKYLVDEGCDINSKEASGLKPIHIAAKENDKDIVQFFLSKGLSVNDPSVENQTLLHYAVIKSDYRVEFVKCLIDQNADVNAKDIHGITPIHLAAKHGLLATLELLLKSGAIYNAVDNLYKKPLDMAMNREDSLISYDPIINLLTKTETLFEAVQQNNASEVQKCVKTGAYVNAKSADGETPLHYAAKKGYDKVANILLQNQANPNVTGYDGFAPLHYAAKFTHLKCVKVLLGNYAKYDAITDDGKTPADFTVDVRITRLLTLVQKSFEYIENGNSQLIIDLNMIKDIDTIRAVMCARNRKNETLVVAAIRNTNFAETEQLKNMSQGDISANVNEALVLLSRDNYQEALNIFKSVFERRIRILGPDNPATLDIEIHIAQVLYKLGSYQEASNILREIVRKHEEISNNFDFKDYYKAIIMLNLALFSHGIESEKIIDSCQEIYQKQSKLLGPNHLDTLDTELITALAMNRQGKYHEALNMNTAVFNKINKISDANHPIALRAQDNIAMVLANLGKLEEALKLCNDVFERKKVVYGINHSDTLTTLNNIGVVLFYQEKFHAALKKHQEVLDIRKTILGSNHPDTLTTQYNIANVLFSQGKWISAYKVYTKDCDELVTVLAENHPTVADISNIFYEILWYGSLLDCNIRYFIENLQDDLNFAIRNGELLTIQRLLKYGANAKDVNMHGETPLHCAVSNGQLSVLNILIQNGADVTQIKNSEAQKFRYVSVSSSAPSSHQTLLHTATSKGYNKIAEVLLQNVSADKLNDFINYKSSVDDNTALHIATINGYLPLTKSLLKHGAIYDIKNNEGKSPLEHLSEKHDELNRSTEQKNIINLLKLVGELFEDAKSCSIEISSKLKAINSDEFKAVTNARNIQGNTLLEVATANKYNNVVSELSEVIKETDQSLQDEME